MTAKKSKTAKKSLTKNTSSFKWYIAIILVALVAIAGIIYMRFSRAAVTPNPVVPGSVTARYDGYSGGYDYYTQYVSGSSQGSKPYRSLGGDKVVNIAGSTRCYQLSPGFKYGWVNMQEIGLGLCSG
ncbi:hypothetical protein HYX70_01670 [Candidatus Saccharibacteria bacterium]|nr:hypothetical protein [Candidatus Saccharibacteria bacterium]